MYLPMISSKPTRWQQGQSWVQKAWANRKFDVHHSPRLLQRPSELTHFLRELIIKKHSFGVLLFKPRPCLSQVPGFSQASVHFSSELFEGAEDLLHPAWWAREPRVGTGRSGRPPKALGTAGEVDGSTFPFYIILPNVGCLVKSDWKGCFWRWQPTRLKEYSAVVPDLTQKTTKPPALSWPTMFIGSSSGSVGFLALQAIDWLQGRILPCHLPPHWHVKSALRRRTGDFEIHMRLIITYYIGPARVDNIFKI